MPAPPSSQRLMAALVIGDAIAIVVGYLAVMYFTGAFRPGSLLELLVDVVAVVASGLLIMRSQHLWVDRIIAVRAIELSRLARAVVLLGLATIVLDRAIKLYIHVEEIFIGCATVMIALVAWRSVYRTWLATQRKSGNFQRRMLIVGTDRRAVDLVRLFRTHPEAGVVVVGLIGSAREARMAGLSDLWLANYIDADDVLADADVEAVVLCSSDINPALLDVLVRGERSRAPGSVPRPRAGGHRLPPGAGAADRPPAVAVRRGADAVAARSWASSGRSTSPSPPPCSSCCRRVLALVAALIKLDDRGPVLFRQGRVGRGRRRVRDAQVPHDGRRRRGAARRLRPSNERSGPLFKMDGHDPRVTRIGRFLRATSLDELPQLFNVLRGDMSLVGPRPALAVRGRRVPRGARARHRVRPGITGLWQVEARDNPSFDAYRRLDLFYVENWSLALDLHDPARHARPDRAATARDSPPAGARAGVADALKVGVTAVNVSASIPAGWRRVANGVGDSGMTARRCARISNVLVLIR